ncbi:MAG: aldehyde dehydrogenase family protein, partial [Fimbriimonadales bacterium]|nr:aldehyde dehydrogenase family protein [Fimbriimonadales bacterium]
MHSHKEFLTSLIPNLSQYEGSDLLVTSPIDGSILATLKIDSNQDIDWKIAASVQAFREWRNVPAPLRGELIRVFGNKLRTNKEALAKLVTLECGKILEEGRGEVQEMID